MKSGHKNKADGYRMGGLFTRDIQLQDGDNPVRLCAGKWREYSHWIATIIEDNDNAGEYKAISKHINCTPKGHGCLIDEVAKAETDTMPEGKYSRLSRQFRFVFAAISRKEQDTGETVIRPIRLAFKAYQQLQEIAKEWGKDKDKDDFYSYDVNIKKMKAVSQTGKETGYYEYHVVPVKGSDKPLNAAEEAALAEVDEAFYDDMIAPMDPDDMKDLLDSFPLNLKAKDRGGKFIRNEKVVKEACERVGWPTVEGVVSSDELFEGDDDEGEDEGKAKPEAEAKPEEKKPEPKPEPAKETVAAGAGEQPKKKRPW